MRYEAIEVTVQASSGLDWNSLLSAVVGGAIALIGGLINQRWNEKARREARLSELVEECRSSAMALSRFVREADEQRASEVMVRLERVLISLQAHGARWQKKHNKAHRGFAGTIRSLSRELAERAQGGVSDAYFKALEAMVVACLAWEEAPKRFVQGDCSTDILEGRWSQAKP